MTAITNFTSREQLADTIGNLIFSTPPEFIQFDDIDIELGDEIIVDGNPETEWYDGCKLTLQEEGYIVIRIPLKRRASIYEYHADLLDKEREEFEQRVKDLLLVQKMYRHIALSERERNAESERRRKDGVDADV